MKCTIIDDFEKINLLPFHIIGNEFMRYTLFLTLLLLGFLMDVRLLGGGGKITPLSKILPNSDMNPNFCMMREEHTYFPKIPSLLPIW